MEEHLHFCKSSGPALRSSRSMFLCRFLACWSSSCNSSRRIPTTRPNPAPPLQPLSLPPPTPPPPLPLSGVTWFVASAPLSLGPFFAVSRKHSDNKLSAKHFLSSGRN
ncbi:hypothetical protein ACA910_008945 [Epithemia clementina (nom. ined.)]